MAASPAEFAAGSVRRYALTGHDLVVEVGSGEGCLLQAVRGLGPRVLGIEPDGGRRPGRSGAGSAPAPRPSPLRPRTPSASGTARVIVTRAAVGVSPEFVAAATRCLTPDGLIVMTGGGASFAELRPLAAPLPRAA
jgi:hypothetical protein